MAIGLFWRPLAGSFVKRSLRSSRLTKSSTTSISRCFASDAIPQENINQVAEFLAKHEITIEGNGVEKLRPVFSFDEASFPASIVQALNSKYETPSVIQSVTWPAVLQGRDLVGVARTGSGKTLAFTLPALVHVTQQGPIKRGDGPIVVVLCPTRELAQQVQAVADEWSNILARVRTMCVFGGASRSPQQNKLLSGVEVVVATPGRLNDFLRSDVTNMRRCTYLVLDEADRMLDMGFEPQIREIISQIGEDRQTLMYSATWPKEVRSLAADFMKDYMYVKIGSADLSANKNIKQIVHVTTKAARDKEFWKLLTDLQDRDPNGKILVFSLQKVVADQLSRVAKTRGMTAMAIHGDKSQAMRDNILSSFRHGRTRILFATDVAARGLDVDDIKCVVNYDHPFCVEDYVHRIGRTARRDLKGESHTFLTEEDSGEQMRDLIQVLEASGQSVPEALRQMATVSATSNKARRRWGSNNSFSRPYGAAGSSNRWDRNRYGSGYGREASPRRTPVYGNDRYYDDENTNARRSYTSYDRYANTDGRGPRKFQRWSIDEDFDVDGSKGYGGFRK